MSPAGFYGSQLPALPAGSGWTCFDSSQHLMQLVAVTPHSAGAGNRYFLTRRRETRGAAGKAVLLRQGYPGMGQHGFPLLSGAGHQHCPAARGPFGEHLLSFSVNNEAGPPQNPKRLRVTPRAASWAGWRWPVTVTECHPALPGAAPSPAVSRLQCSSKAGEAALEQGPRRPTDPPEMGTPLAAARPTPPEGYWDQYQAGTGCPSPPGSPGSGRAHEGPWDTGSSVWQPSRTPLAAGPGCLGTSG